MRMGVLAAMVACALVSACASSEANIQRETAASIGDGVAPEAVSVWAIRRGVMDVKWEANTPKGRYSCGADDKMRRTYCVKAGSGR